MRVGELLDLVAGGMRAVPLRGSYLRADEAVVPVQMHDGRGSDHQAYLWQYGTLSNGRGGETMFDFQLGRGRDGPAKFLKDWNGILQTDGYQAYAQVGGAGLIHGGGELDAAGSAGENELAARGQREVRTQGGGDHLGGGILPPARRAGQRISAGRPRG